MRKISVAAIFLVAASALFISNRAGAQSEKIYKLGDAGPAGGVIFYDKGNTSNGWRYLEAAPEDQGKAAWGCYEVYLKGAKYTGFGYGKINTQAMLTVCNEPGTAAKLCADYRGGGKKDWFLPSKDELAEMFKILIKIKNNKLVYESYWSSSQYNANSGWMQNFHGLIDYHIGKDTLQRVRAIRSF